MTPSMPPPGSPPKPEIEIGIDAGGAEESFSCPSCGAKLRCESAEESEMGGMGASEE